MQRGVPVLLGPWRIGEVSGVSPREGLIACQGFRILAVPSNFVGTCAPIV